MKKSISITNVLLLLMILGLLIFPLFYARDGDFSGADGQAEEVIASITPHYEPWFTSVWEPPSGEIESLLFALQGALGAGVIFYYIGYQKGKRHALKKINKK